MDNNTAVAYIDNLGGGGGGGGGQASLICVKQL